jgi:leucine dehydrogenase
LGAVGAPLARGLLAAGVGELVVADPDPARRQAFLAEGASAVGGERVRVVEPEEVLFLDVDVVSPNALGGVIGPEEIERLRCKILMGAANNQLRAVSQAEELDLAQRLHERGVLYQVDWMHNAAGVIAGYEEWEHQEQASMERVATHLTRVCGEGVRENLARAARDGLTPTALAYQRIEAEIYVD